MLGSAELDGDLPSLIAATLSPPQHHDADAAAGIDQSIASAPSLIRGNVVIRTRCAPIGSSATVSFGWVERAGPGWSVRTTPSASACQFGIFRPVTLSATGAPS